MTIRTPRKPIDEWFGQPIRPGEQADVALPLSESYSGISLRIPIRIQRSVAEGPVVFVTAAIHGDELNGTGAIRHLICDESVQLQRGTLILVPILNLLGFERHSRYLPDRRDLNRCFPGSASGSVASRIARQVFDEIVARSDLGIDLHTAALRRTNYPNVRADLRNPTVREMALHFGTEVIMNTVGERGTLRRESCQAHCPTIIMEGGEVSKVEPAIVETMVRGIKNVLRHHGMLEGDVERSETQIIIERAKWVRAERGGFLQFHVRPGQLVEKNQPLATNTDLLGREQSVQVAPFHGVILGMTTLPAISPGAPICHVGELPSSTWADQLRESRSENHALEERIVEDLASNVMVIDPDRQDSNS